MMYPSCISWNYYILFLLIPWFSKNNNHQEMQEWYNYCFFFLFKVPLQQLSRGFILCYLFNDSDVFVEQTLALPGSLKKTNLIPRLFECMWYFSLLLTSLTQIWVFVSRYELEGLEALTQEDVDGGVVGPVAPLVDDDPGVPQTGHGLLSTPSTALNCTTLTFLRLRLL